LCQEAREAKAAGLLAIDFCTGAPLVAYPPDENLLVNINSPTASSSSSSNSSSSSSSGVNANGNAFAISLTSKIILTFSAFLLLSSIVVLLAIEKGANVIVLLLVFLQPLVILFFVYWRKHRHLVALDLVIKIFATGFFIVTIQSVVIESLLQGILFVLLTPFLGGGMGQLGPPNDGGGDGVPQGGDDDYGPPPPPHQSSQKLFFLQHTMSGALNWMVNIAAAAGGGGEGGRGAPNDDDGPLIADQSDSMRQSMKDNFIVAVVGVFAMSFIVAAGVEETLKHFVVRCTYFPSPLRNPRAVLIYMMTGALGFATCENLMYVFEIKSSPVPGTSLFLGELIVLLVRILMPVHVICSVFQAKNLSAILMSQQHMSLFRLLVTAIIIHGSYDFSLYLSAVLQFVSASNDIAYILVPFSFVVSITLSAGIYAYRSYKAIEGAHDGYGQLAQGTLHDDEDGEL